MKSAAILSIVDRNYGNRLQAAALHMVLADAGVVPTSITILPDADTPLRKLRRALGGYKRALMCKVGTTGSDRRTAAFDEFTRRYAPLTATDVAGIPDVADGYVVGSDQCWNPSWDIGARTDGAQCAMQVPADAKLAYAASFGIPLGKMSTDWQQRYATWLSSFRPGTVSVREEAGAAIVRALTGRDVPVVVDPTMLVSAARWTTVEHRPAILGLKEGAFCLKYVLGDDQNATVIDDLAAQRGLKVIDLRNVALPVGPAEFLWLIHHSALVCTDSFHATVFALLFHKPFIVFERCESTNCDMSCRFDTLAAKFAIQANRYAGGSFSEDAVWQRDWDASDALLAAERRTSAQWLAQALHTTFGLPVE